MPLASSDTNIRIDPIASIDQGPLHAPEGCRARRLAGLVSDLVRRWWLHLGPAGLAGDAPGQHAAAALRLADRRPVGVTPVIDAVELRLLPIAYRRALGSPEMPDPEFLDDLAHELKNQFPSNADQRD